MEAQVSFVVVPLKGKKYKMIIVLCALTLLDSTPLKVSYSIMMTNIKIIH
jgi:hypothetical protein